MFLSLRSSFYGTVQAKFQILPCLSKTLVQKLSSSKGTYSQNEDYKVIFSIKSRHQLYTLLINIHKLDLSFSLIKIWPENDIAHFLFDLCNKKWCHGCWSEYKMEYISDGEKSLDIDNDLTPMVNMYGKL